MCNFLSSPLNPPSAPPPLSYIFSFSLHTGSQASSLATMNNPPPQGVPPPRVPPPNTNGGGGGDGSKAPPQFMFGTINQGILAGVGVSISSGSPAAARGAVAAAIPDARARARPVPPRSLFHPHSSTHKRKRDSRFFSFFFPSLAFFSVLTQKKMRRQRTVLSSCPQYHLPFSALRKPPPRATTFPLLTRFTPPSLSPHLHLTRT